MIFGIFTLLSFPLSQSTDGDAVNATIPPSPHFTGEEHWREDDMELCENPERLNGSLSCYSYLFNYQRLNVEVLSEDPILIIYRDFAPENYVTDFLSDVRKRKLKKQLVVDYEKDKLGSAKRTSVREANGTWFSHEETSGVAKMFRRVKAMLPSINFKYSEKWQVLSYYPGGHYAPHFDYITYTSPKQWSDWMKNYGHRMATFLLMLQPATKGGGTLFPELRVTVMPSRGDAIFWTNMNATGEMELNSAHGGCVVWEGEKIATTLWIRAKDQELLRSLLPNGKLDIERLIRPRWEYLGLTPVNR